MANYREEGLLLTQKMDQLVKDWKQVEAECGLEPRPSDKRNVELYAFRDVDVRQGWTLADLREIASRIKHNMDDRHKYVRTWLVLQGTIERPVVMFKAEYAVGDQCIPKVGKTVQGECTSSSLSLKMKRLHVCKGSVV